MKRYFNKVTNTTSSTTNTPKKRKTDVDELTIFNNLKEDYSLEIKKKRGVNFLILKTEELQIVRHMELYSLLENKHFLKYANEEKIEGIYLNFNREKDQLSKTLYTKLKTTLPNLKYFYFNEKVYAPNTRQSHSDTYQFNRYIETYYGFYTEIGKVGDSYHIYVFDTMLDDDSIYSTYEIIKYNLKRIDICHVYNLIYPVSHYFVKNNIMTHIKVLIINNYDTSDIVSLFEDIKLKWKGGVHRLISLTYTVESENKTEKSLPELFSEIGSLANYISFIPNNIEFYATESYKYLKGLNRNRFNIHLSDGNLVGEFVRKFKIISLWRFREECVPIPLLCIQIIYDYAYPHMVLQTHNYRYSRLTRRHFENIEGLNVF